MQQIMERITELISKLSMSPSYRKERENLKVHAMANHEKHNGHEGSQYTHTKEGEIQS
jgi:hypothetical protein